MIAVIRHLNPARAYGQDLAPRINHQHRAQRRVLAAQRALLVLWYCALCAGLGFMLGQILGGL